MSQPLALFPLQIVVFPGEKVPLHIFEMRYRELLKDCEEQNMTFGIPTYIKGKLGYGSEVSLHKVAKRYDSGELDVICRASRVFRITSFHNPLPGKLYSGGDVVFLENIDDGVDSQRIRVIDLIEELYKLIGVGFQALSVEGFRSYDLAHKIGLNLEQEYHLLQLERESERLRYVERHLKKVIPIIEQVNTTKKLIQMNGHFRNFDPLDFKDFKL
ncbi:LON peptidase substrate-binding domain-containing protein [Robertkochia aurantiaca]|uniref:LON peptidase substrate-binding domain-containing protein n=1 Tax=Robertkochia aurantiaca TaxID=2873700 RepID=UPI001CD01BD4|nr:LON peptidase substrate-binding domain-containing protein [Robertkochia sp. 3YJGBD-33]